MPDSLMPVQEFKVSKIEASSIHLDQSLRMRDEMERSRSRRKNSPVSLANIAMIAAAAGIATALCRELQVQQADASCMHISEIMADLPVSLAQ